MPRKKGLAELKGGALNIFRGGKGVSQNAVRQYLTDLRNKKSKQNDKASAIKQQMGKYFSEIQKAGKAAPGQENTKALAPRSPAITAAATTQRWAFIFIR